MKLPALPRSASGLLAVAAALVSVLGAAVFLVAPDPAQGRSEATPRAVSPRGALTADEQAHIEVFRKTSASVVHITTLAAQRDLFSMNVQQVPRGTGTGFVWDDRGHIVTNDRVIQGATAARVTLSDQSVHEATLVGAFADRDLAVLKIDLPRTGFPPIPIGGNLGEVVAGDVIAAINDDPVADLDDMLTVLERRQPGDTVTLTVWRAGQSRKQSVVLGNSE